MTLEEMEKYAKEHSVPIMEKEGIEFLTKYIKDNNVKSILEIGAAIGYSAIRMCNISDDITYQWYQTMDDEPVVGGDIALTGATGSTFIPTSTGKFYCQVTNHKNDTTSSVVSQIFYVV